MEHYLARTETSHAIRVVIYGRHTRDWMTALAPDAPVWRRMAGVQEVLSIPDTSVRIPEPSHGGIRTVVIPLMENHTRRYRRKYPSLIPDHRSLDVLGNK